MKKTFVLFFSSVIFIGCLSAASYAQAPIGSSNLDILMRQRMWDNHWKRRLKERRGAAGSSRTTTTSRRGTAAKRGTSRKTVAPARKRIGYAAPTAANTANTESTAAKVAPSSYAYVRISRDSFQDFHLDDIKGYAVNFGFTPVGGGKTIFKTYSYNYYNDLAEFNGVPPGRYTVKAEAVYQNRKYPVYLGSENGTPTNPNGGNFAPSITIEVKPGTDAYGYKVLETSPNALYVRVIE